MRKIKYFVLAMISFLLINIENVYGETLWTIQTAGEGGNSYSQFVEGETYWVDEHWGYRVTFLDKNGGTIGNSVDVFLGNKEASSDVYFSSNFTRSKYSLLPGSAIQISDINPTDSVKKYRYYAGCNSDQECLDFIESEFKNSVSNKKNTTFVANLLSNAGLSTLSKDSAPYISVEKLYTIQLQYGSLVSVNDNRVCTDLRNGISGAEDVINALFNSLSDIQTASEYCDGLDHSISHHVNSQIMLEKETKRYTGTGSEIGRLLNYLGRAERLNYGITVSEKNIPGISAGIVYGINNLIYKKTFDSSLQLFGKLVSINSSDIKNVKNWKSGNVSIADKLGLTDPGDGCADKTPYSLSCLYNKKYAYNLYLINIYPDNITDTCKTESDAKKLGRDWAGSYCCLPGQKYNTSTKTCFTYDQIVSDNYYYTCDAGINICKDGGVNSILKSFSSGSGTHNSQSLTVSNGECVFNNMKYKEATNLYCSDTIDTDFSNIINVSSVKSGSFVPVNASNAKIKVTKKCYSTSPNIQTLVYTQFQKTYGPDISVTFLGNNISLSSQSYTLPTNAVTLENGGKTRNTNYGEKYYEASVTLTYDYSASIYNQYVDIKSAKGSLSSSLPINSSSTKTLSSSVNISVPMDKASGTYPVNYNFESISSTALDHIFNGTFGGEEVYAYQKSSSCLVTCTVTYKDNIDSNDCSDKKTEFDKVFKGGYSLDDNNKNWSNNTCTIIYKFKTNSEAECRRSIGSQPGMTTSYAQSTTCNDFVIFNNKSNAPSSNSFSCNKNITVTDDDLYEKLVFRSIDLSNPFPGKLGSGRDSGINWSKDEIKKYITDRQDVYSKKPLYSVTLTTSDIKGIREYNDSHGYDDFELSCKDNGSSACYSQFIRLYLTESESNCYNKNSQTTAELITSFNSCADYSSRT